MGVAPEGPESLFTSEDADRIFDTIGDLAGSDAASDDSGGNRSNGDHSNIND